MDFFQGGFAFCRPGIGPRLGIAQAEIGADALDQFLDRGKTARANDVAGQVGEEPLPRLGHDDDVGVKCIFRRGCLDIRTASPVCPLDDNAFVMFSNRRRRRYTPSGTFIVACGRPLPARPNAVALLFFDSWMTSNREPFRRLEQRLEAVLAPQPLGRV